MLAEFVPSVKQGCHDLGKLWHALDKFAYSCFEFDYANHSNRAKPRRSRLLMTP
jgi:hypothetical protein